MRTALALFVSMCLMAKGPAHAINATYAKQLERSGCTQVSEAQGCDIRKSKAENQKAGFASPAVGGEIRPAAALAASSAQSPYAGQWVAKGASGAVFAHIRIDAQERAWVNGKRVKVKRSDGALVLRDGAVVYTIQGDRRLEGEDTWVDQDAGTQGLIAAE